jgi:hypothetical protein
VSKTHDLVFDCVVTGFDSSVFLIEGIFDDAAWCKIYFEVSLQRMLSP